jgi:hypothetical protein
MGSMAKDLLLERGTEIRLDYNRPIGHKYIILCF